MDKVRDNFDTYRNDVDDILYYNLDEYNRMLDEEELESARKKAREEGLKEGREEGIKQGIKQGIKEGIEQIAKKMKESNIDITTITNVTNLSIDEINKL